MIVDQESVGTLAHIYLLLYRIISAYCHETDTLLGYIKITQTKVSELFHPVVFGFKTPNYI